MQTHFITFRKLLTLHTTIRVEFAIPALTKQEARLIAEKEAAQLRGFRYLDSN